MLVEFRGVSFAYPVSAGHRARPFALSELSFEIAPGEIVGVIGPNSSGKTTLIRLLTRVLEPAAGEIHLEGAPIRQLTRTDLARRVGVVPQGTLAQVPFNVGDLVLMGRYPHGPGRYFESPRDRTRSEERRVGKECRSRWSPEHTKKKEYGAMWRKREEYR